MVDINVRQKHCGCGCWRVLAYGDIVISVNGSGVYIASWKS